MPPLSGLGLTGQILIFTTHESRELARDARRVEARGFVTKSAASRHLVVAIESLLSGGTFFGGPQKLQDDPSENPGSGILFQRWVSREGIQVESAKSNQA
jgi:DNA-binding NarL/FixJ family response regulator